MYLIYFCFFSQIRYSEEMQPVVQIACGYYHFIFLTNDGKVFVMGNNNSGQLGIGKSKTVVTQAVYLKSLQGIPVMQIACGGYHSLVLSVSGNIFSFGKNELVTTIFYSQNYSKLFKLLLILIFQASASWASVTQMTVHIP